MAERRSGALVVGYRKEDPRRHVRARAAAIRPGLIRTPSGLVVPSSGVVRRPEHELDCNHAAGACISCGRTVYLNSLGMSALHEKDADVCCMECEDRYSAEMTRSL